MFLHKGIALDKAVERISIKPFAILCKFLNLEFIIFLIQLTKGCNFENSSF